MPYVAENDVENENVFSALLNIVQMNLDIDKHWFDVVNSNADVHNVVSMLIWHCDRSRRHINLKAKLKQRWNIY